MSTEGDELGPFRQVPDNLVLAAVKRAELHEHERVSTRHVAEHLGSRYTAATTRRLRPQLEALRAAGALVHTRERGQDLWALTATGRRRLAAARAAGELELPESPQHRRWRHARSEAGARYCELRTLAYETLEAAEGALGSAAEPGSAELGDLGERLRAAFCLLASATYCRDEWPEPCEGRADPAARDPAGHGLRDTAKWQTHERTAKGETHG